LKIFFLNLVNVYKRSSQDLLKILRRKDFFKLLKRKFWRYFKDLHKFLHRIVKDLPKIFQRFLKKRFWEDYQKKFYLLRLFHSWDLTSFLFKIFWRSSFDLDQISQLILREMCKRSFEGMLWNLLKIVKRSSKISPKDLQNQIFLCRIEPYLRKTLGRFEVDLYVRSYEIWFMGSARSVLKHSQRVETVWNGENSKDQSF